MLAISVLGPVEIRRDAQPLFVPAGGTTEVLIRLALDATVTVSVGRLITDLWGVEATCHRTQHRADQDLQAAAGPR